MPDRIERACIFCKKPVEAWFPYKAGRESEFLRRLDVIGSNLERFACPHCGSMDRERHLRLFLERTDALAPLAGGSVLHFAPERHLSEYLRDYRPSEYVKGDLLPSDPSIRQIDVTHIPFPPETFDLAICNHVLEHVDDHGTALRELHRVLKPGARLICQTPYAARLSTTFEDPALQSDEDRLFFYGEEAHLRLFGADLPEIIRHAGFRGDLISHSKLLPDIDPERVGVNEKEPFFDFVRT